MRVGAVVVLLGLCGCSDPTAGGAGPVEVSDSDEGGAVDPGLPPDDGPQVDPDPGVEPDPGPEPTPDPCAERCAPWAECGSWVEAACLRSCADEAVATCEDECLGDAPSCEAAVACFGAEESVSSAFSGPPWGTGWRDVVGPFALETLRGGYDVETAWTGNDNHVFVVTQTGHEYSDQLLGSEVYYWLDQSPPNVQYFFVSWPDGDGSDNAAANVTTLSEKVEESLVKLGIIKGRAAECHWRRRIHYVTTVAPSIGDWMGAWLQTHPVLAFAIDRFQRLRPVGLLSLAGGPPLLFHLQYEPMQFDFEWEREQSLVKDGVTEVLLIADTEHTGSQTVDVDLPPVAEMAAFDRLEVDLSSMCKDHADESCGEWDTGASLSVSEYPLEEGNADATTPCQDGETVGCSCVVPGSPDLRPAEKTCEAEGDGFTDCPCGKAVEVTRWITTYHREGRWISDHSRALPLLSQGGKTRFHYSPGNATITTLKLRLYTAGDADRPTQLVPLFQGGGFNAGYNDGREPIDVAIPDSAARVEILAHITGHGFGTADNCAEFCNHVHHFFVGDEEYVHDQPWVDNYYGCAKQIDQGVIANQFGTWTIGRAGWCPGLDVKPFIADVTAATTPGEVATITYEGLYEDGTTPPPAGSIWMESWLVVYE